MHAQYNVEVIDCQQSAKVGQPFNLHGGYIYLNKLLHAALQRTLAIRFFQVQFHHVNISLDCGPSAQWVQCVSGLSGAGERMAPEHAGNICWCLLRWG